MIVNKKKFFCCWSAGKESAMSLYKSLTSGKEVDYLLTMLNSTGKKSRSHGISMDLLESQEKSLGIPLVKTAATWASYEMKFKKSIKKFGSLGVSCGIFGDIDLKQHREWDERVCKESGLEAHLPLWNRNRESLLKELVQSGFKAVVIAVRSDCMGKEWLGRVIDNEFISDIKKQGNVDLCGEKGEYHTFVYDGPIFKKEIEFVKYKERKFKGLHFLEIRKR